MKRTISHHILVTGVNVEVAGNEHSVRITQIAQAGDRHRDIHLGLPEAQELYEALGEVLRWKGLIT